MACITDWLPIKTFENSQNKFYHVKISLYIYIVTNNKDMTLEITARNYPILSAALVNRMERIEQMIEIFSKEEDRTAKEAYQQELIDAKNLQLDIIKCFMSL
jgi:hypothetical protein